MAAKKRSSREPKLPVQQLSILAICRFAEPVVMTSVFPYLPEMIESFGIPRKEAPKWVGITSSCFSLSQCLTAILWGRASDRYGRKPIIMIGLACTMITSLLFGMAKTLPWAIVARSLAGACNGNVGIIRTMVAEMVPEKVLQPRAFSIMPLVWTIGSILGPTIGGFFASPARRFPDIFGKSKFFIEFPFALPNMAIAVLFMIGITTGILFLHETMEAKKYSRDYGIILGQKLLAGFKRTIKKISQHLHLSPQDENGETEPLLSESSSQSISSKVGDEERSSEDIKPALPPPSMKEVFTRQSSINLVAYAFLALHVVTFDQLLTVFMHQPRLDPNSPSTSLPFKFDGGFGLDSDRIGTLFSLYGAFGCFTQFVVFPPVARKYGILRCYKFCSLTFPIIYIITPYTALIQTPIYQQIVIFIIMLARGTCGIFAFPCITILMTNSALSLRVLGTLNGFATSVSAIGRAAGPAIGGLAFTFGVKHGYIITPWWTLALMSLLGVIPAWFLVEMEGFGGTKDQDDEDEDEDEDNLFPESDEGDLHGNGVNGTAGEHSNGVGASGLNSQRRFSGPIGTGIIGPGGDKHSNGIGQSESGKTTGATSFL